MPHIFPAGCGDAGGAGDVNCTGFPQIPQNFSVPDSGLPHDAQTCGGVGGTCCVTPAEVGWFCTTVAGESSTPFASGIFALQPASAPHIPQNFPFSKSGEPQDAHPLAGAGAGISGSGSAAGGCSPAGDPHIPQYFSSGLNGLLQELQSSCAAGSTGTCGDAAGGTCRD